MRPRMLLSLIFQITCLFTSVYGALDIVDDFAGENSEGSTGAPETAGAAGPTGTVKHGVASRFLGAPENADASGFTGAADVTGDSAGDEEEAGERLVDYVVASVISIQKRRLTRYMQHASKNLQSLQDILKAHPDWTVQQQHKAQVDAVRQATALLLAASIYCEDAWKAEHQTLLNNLEELLSDLEHFPGFPKNKEEEQHQTQPKVLEEQLQKLINLFRPPES